MITVVKTHAHREKIKKRQYQPPFPRRKHPYNILDGDPHENSQGIRAANCCHKDLNHRGFRDPRFSLLVL